MVYFSAGLSALMGSSAALMSMKQRNGCVEWKDRTNLAGGGESGKDISACKT